MEDLFVRVKGIIQKGDKYLVLKKWVDDRIPEPYVWEFVDTIVGHGETPDEAMLRAVREILSVDGVLDRVAYTWSIMLSDTQCIGIAYVCSIPEDEETGIMLDEEYEEMMWITKEQFPEFIDNQFVLNDIMNKL